VKDAREKIHNKTVAYGILVRLDRSRFRKLIEQVREWFPKGLWQLPNDPYGSIQSSCQISKLWKFE